MRQLVESLLFLARLDSQPESIEKQSCELRKVVNETVLQLQILAEKRNVSLTTDLESATILGDALQLARLVTNLVQNAIDYNRPGGSVRIELKHSENQIELRVIDTGIGIATSDVPKLFDRFYRVDQARSRQIGGTGLGLAICRSIVEAHHGTIEVESTLGEGTTFVVRF
jgi:two-component system phosphate regulon sensor histidine kinase PhoR